jgi:hypothetical protein
MHRGLAAYIGLGAWIDGQRLSADAGRPGDGLARPGVDVAVEFVQHALCAGFKLYYKLSVVHSVSSGYVVGVLPADILARPPCS